MAEADEPFWTEHGRAVATIRERLRDELRGPQAAAMVFPRFLALLLRAQREAAERIGKKADDASLAARFSAEEAELKKSCGL